MTTYKVYFFLKPPSNSSMLALEMHHNEKHDSYNHFVSSAKRVGDMLGLEYSYMEEK